MMKTVVLGGSGHIGSYLIPKLVKANYHVICVSRGKNKPYTNDIIWKEVEYLLLDRQKTSNFEQTIASLNADIVVDLINFTLKQTKSITNALRYTNLSHYLYCSSIWAHGRATILPITEEQPKFPLDEYGRQKAQSEAYLHELYKQENFPETVIMPGQISGPGWSIINPTANDDILIFDKIRRGVEIAIPNFGMETLHHVHADDVAQAFYKAITHKKNALGESFHAVGNNSITLLGYARAMYHWFNQQENIKLLPWTKWCNYTKNKALIDKTYYHIARSGYYSIEKGKNLINYYPQHTILETIKESVTYMLEQNWFER